MNQVTSKTITAIRFPMMVFVVILHTFIIDRPISGVIYVPRGKFGGFDIFQQLIQNEICTVAVPMFFFLSGFLFFNGIQSFDIKQFQIKLKKRFFSLFIPYMLWNIIFLFFVCMVGFFYPALLTYKKTIFQMSIFEILFTFWESSQGLLPLWFLRDLMIVNLCSPIIYLMLRSKHSKVFLFVFAMLYIIPTKVHFVPGIGMRCAFPYMFGAWFSINNKDFIAFFKKYSLLWLILSVLLIVACFVVWNYHNYIFIIDKAKDLSLVISFLLLVAFVVKKHIILVSPLLADASFFVFVFHMFIIHIPLKLWIYIFPVNGWTASLCLILIPLVISYTCVLVYIFFKRQIPYVSNLLMGKR